MVRINAWVVSGLHQVSWACNVHLLLNSAEGMITRWEPVLLAPFATTFCAAMLCVTCG